LLTFLRAFIQGSLSPAVVRVQRGLKPGESARCVVATSGTAESPWALAAAPGGAATPAAAGFKGQSRERIDSWWNPTAAMTLDERKGDPGDHERRAVNPCCRASGAAEGEEKMLQAQGAGDQATGALREGDRRLDAAPGPDRPIRFQLSEQRASTHCEIFARRFRVDLQASRVNQPTPITLWSSAKACSIPTRAKAVNCSGLCPAMLTPAGAHQHQRLSQAQLVLIRHGGSAGLSNRYR